MKSCNKCGLLKAFRDYQKKASTKDGYARTCRKCDNAIRVQRRIEQGKRLPDPPPGTKRCNKCAEAKPLDDFYVRKSGPQAGKVHAYCIPCVKVDNTARARARGVAEWTPAHPEYKWRRRLMVHYRMTAEDYHRILAAQQNRCLGCDIHADDAGKKFSVDHDHSCCPESTSCGACIRGLLCGACNVAIGYARDDPATLERLATYLRAHAAS